MWPSLRERLLLSCLTSKSLSVACVHSAHCYHWMTIHSTSQVYWLSSSPGWQSARRRVEDFNTETMVRFASLKGKDRWAWCLIASSSAGRHLFSQRHGEQPNHSELLHLLCNWSNSIWNAEAHYFLQHMFKCHFSVSGESLCRITRPKWILQGSRFDRFLKQGQRVAFLLSLTNRNERPVE